MPWAQYSAYFTHKFWADHVYEGEEGAKKEAEQVFMRRTVAVSTVLQLDHHAIRVLVGEVIGRQPEYADSPAGLFMSLGEYAYWERSGKRAKRQGPACFRYAVRQEEGVWKIHHFDGVV